MTENNPPTPEQLAEAHAKQRYENSYDKFGFNHWACVKDFIDGYTANIQTKKLTPITIPMRSLKFGCDYFKKKNLPDFTDNSTDEEKWIFNELTKAYCKGAEEFAGKYPQPAPSKDV